MKRDRLTEYAIELQSLAQAGLHYGKDIYDRERYERIREIAAEIISMKTELPLDTVTGMFCSDSGYQTPKVDTRAAVFQDGRQLSGESRNDGEPLVQPRGASGKPCGGEGHEGAALDVLRREGRSKLAADARLSRRSRKALYARRALRGFDRQMPAFLAGISAL